MLLIAASQDRWIFPSQSWEVRNSDDDDDSNNNNNNNNNNKSIPVIILSNARLYISYNNCPDKQTVSRFLLSFLHCYKMMLVPHIKSLLIATSHFIGQWE